jgi:hypothetical protein
MSAARLALWHREVALYAFLAPRNAYRLHIKVLSPDADGHVGCGNTIFCYAYANHTVRIIDDALRSRSLLHEYGHYVHHTYLPEGYFSRQSCLTHGLTEGIADALRESFRWNIKSNSASDSLFLNSDEFLISTPTRDKVQPAIGMTMQCTGNVYVDGEAVSQILWSFLNNRVCVFDSLSGEAAPCQVRTLVTDARLAAAPIAQWGRESFTWAMQWAGFLGFLSGGASPFEFVSDMASWFRLLSDVYQLIQPDEWERIRMLFALHGVEIGDQSP